MSTKPTAKQILRKLRPHAVLVGSAARGENYNDLDLIVGKRGLDVAKEILPDWESGFVGHLKTWATDPPIEVMRYWYGPEYSDLKKRRDLIEVRIEGVWLWSWGEETQWPAT